MTMYQQCHLNETAHIAAIIVMFLAGVCVGAIIVHLFRKS